MTPAASTATPPTPTLSPPLVHVQDFLTPDLRFPSLTGAPSAPTTTTPAHAQPVLTPSTAGALSVQTLMQAHAHLGHAATKMHKHMLPYIYGER